MLIPARTGGAPVAPTDSAALATSIPTEAWILLGLTAVGALLRFAMLGTQSYWVDEAQAAHELHLSFGAMLSAIGRAEPNPPLYFIVGWGWANVFGSTEAGLRSLSAVLGTGLIPLTYLCGRELVSKRAGLAAAALAALSPFLIWYSQEAREYMLLAVLCAASLLFFTRSWRMPSGANLLWWTGFSALALLTNYYAVFLLAPEAAILLYRTRSRICVAGVLVLVAVQAALLPHFIHHASHPRDWIGALPLATRVKQVPVALGLGSLDRSSFISYGLIVAALLVGVLIVLLIVGARAGEMRGIGLAALLAGFVLLAPLLLAVLGRDYYIARALIPAWVPLAIVIGAAATIPASRGRGLAVGGAALLGVMLAAFIYAQVRVDTTSQYQRPDWRGVAAALGTSSRERAIVAYDGSFAAAPLTFYLRASADARSGVPLSVAEVDVVGNALQAVPGTLPRGVQLISSRTVHGYRVARFSLASPWRLTRAQLASRAGSLLGPGAPGAAVLLQSASA